MLARSASVREPAKPHTTVSPVGGLTAKHGQINRNEPSEKTTRDAKRRTVQVEYVAPQSQTTRGEGSGTVIPASSKSRAKEPVGQEAPGPSTDGYQSTNANARTQARPVAANATPANRPARDRDTGRSVSDYSAFATVPPTSVTRPSTGGTLGGASRLPSRGNSYGQPVAATVAQTNAEGRFSQPKGKQYSISGPVSSQVEPSGAETSIGQPSTQRMPVAQTTEGQSTAPKSHRRSNTVSETFGRVTSMFSSRQSHDPARQTQPPNKIQKSYPPTSMAGPMSNDEQPRQSTESPRRTSFGFSRKTTNTSESGGSKASRRFSLLPASLSKTFSSQHRETAPPPSSHSGTDPRRSAAPAPRSRGQSRTGVGLGKGDSRSPSQSTTGSNIPGFYDGQTERNHEPESRRREVRGGPSSAPAQQTRFDYSTPTIGDEKIPGPTVPHPASQSYRDRPYHHPNESEDSAEASTSRQQSRPRYPPGFNSSDPVPQQQQQKERPGVLQKHRKFADAYEDPKSGSSGSAKRVMDLFRRIGRQRGGSKEER